MQPDRRQLLASLAGLVGPYVDRRRRQDCGRGGGDDPSITDAQWSEGARKHFKGRVIVGRDLMEI